MDYLISSLKESLTNPLDLFVLGVVGFIIWKFFFAKKREEVPPPEPQLPPLKKQDMTLEELRKFDGLKDEGRLLLAVDGTIFDVTRAKRLYGKGNIPPPPRKIFCKPLQLKFCGGGGIGFFPDFFRGWG